VPGAGNTRHRRPGTRILRRHLYRVFENKMEYRLEQSRPGYLRLRERLTDSVVRLQTNDRMLTETFWNHYHNRDAATASGG
jgi:hypothetical protein